MRNNKSKKKTKDALRHRGSTSQQRWQQATLQWSETYWRKTEQNTNILTRQRCTPGQVTLCWRGLIGNHKDHVWQNHVETMTWWVVDNDGINGTKDNNVEPKKDHHAMPNIHHTATLRKSWKPQWWFLTLIIMIYYSYFCCCVVVVILA